MIYIFILLLPVLFGCSSADDLFIGGEKGPHINGEYIYRKHHEYFYQPEAPQPGREPLYPWETPFGIPRITKDYFRCRGSALHPELLLESGGEAKPYSDCCGEDEHGLPIREGKEFIYPILIDLLNYLQRATGHRAIITSGHRCPAHNAYVDPSKNNLYSKHLIGAEVSFYMEGMEDKPLETIGLLCDYYREDLPEYASFIRYDAGNKELRSRPWCNKEIFIKLFEADEGRNGDNSHPYPYISIQVRYDRERQEKVEYSWNRANRHYLRK